MPVIGAFSFKQHLERHGVEVPGVTDHSMFHSIDFFDPNGHRVELACPDRQESAMQKRMDEVKWLMRQDWSKTKMAPRHAEWLHKREFVDR